MRIPCSDFIQKVIDMIDQKLKPVLHAKRVKDTRSENMCMSEEGKEIKSLNKDISSDDDWETKSKPKKGNLTMWVIHHLGGNKRKRSEVDIDKLESENESSKSVDKRKGKGKKSKQKKLTKPSSFKLEHKNKMDSKKAGATLDTAQEVFNKIIDFKKNLPGGAKNGPFVTGSSPPSFPPQFLANLLQRGMPLGQMRNSKHMPGFMNQFPSSNEIVRLLAAHSQHKANQNQAANSASGISQSPHPFPFPPPSMFNPNNPINNIIQEKMKHVSFNKSMGSGAQPLQNSVPVVGSMGGSPPMTDPNMLSTNFFQDILKKFIDNQQRLAKLNMNRTTYMQQALSSMYAATNLYQYMSKTNWTSRPPGNASCKHLHHSPSNPAPA